MNEQGMEEFKKNVLDGLKMIEYLFENPRKGDIFFTARQCIMCMIYLRESPPALSDCRGCPFSDMNGDEGCSQLKNYKDANYKWRKICDEIPVAGTNGILMIRIYPDKKEINPQFKLFAFTLRRAIDILKRLPAKRFTPEGWEYVKELDGLRIPSIPGLGE